MKLKKIDNAVVHCKTKKEAEQLVNCFYAENISYSRDAWIGKWDTYEENTCYKIIEGKIMHYGSCSFYKLMRREITEFADLIEPELTAEEAIEWVCKHYSDGEYENAFGEDYEAPDLIKELTVSEIVEKISKWKAEHKKQEPEVECVNVCKIMKIDGSECEKCVYEELLEDGEFATQMANILRRYIASRDGNFVAVQALVYRVKKD